MYSLFRPTVQGGASRRITVQRAAWKIRKVPSAEGIRRDESENVLEPFIMRVTQNSEDHMEPSYQPNRFRRKAVQVEEAQRKIIELVRLGESEVVRLEDAFGRRLACDVHAANDMPHFRRSGMDGFAVQAEATAGASPESPVTLEVIENIPCGSRPAKAVNGKTASRIMTGAMVPDGADAVIMLEMTETFERDGKTFISIKKEILAGQNVAPIGVEVTTGELILEKGAKINAGEAALLAAFGIGELSVFKRPRVAIFSTGSELLDIHSPLEPGKIRNSNTYMLAMLVRDAGGIPQLHESIPDDAELAMRRISAAMAASDFVITTGGVSVGDYDIMADIFDAWDGTMLFNKVTMRPGSPTTAGMWKEKFLFALSGNPGACFVGFELFVRPVLWGMQGKMEVTPPKATAFLGEDFQKVNAYHRFVRGKSYVENGRLLVKQTGPDRSSLMLSIKDSDCLIVIPPGGSGTSAGELVDIIKLGWAE
ncbi:gephyrin-like molybdotransferase Glp [Paenibacillus contaminans]